MAVKIRLARRGRKKLPFYHIVAADSRAPRDGAFLEKLGWYNPLATKGSKERASLNVEKLQHWLCVGAQLTDVVHRIVTDASIPDIKLSQRSKKVSASK